MAEILGRLAVASSLALVLSGCTSFQELSREPMAYIESGYGPRVFPGDEYSRMGRTQLIAGNYGLAEESYRRAVEATPQNGPAWVGLAAAYDQIGRFDFADRAYKKAYALVGANYVVLNNQGYSYMLRGDTRQAQVLLERARRLAPDDPTIDNNLRVLYSGQGYFQGLLM